MKLLEKIVVGLQGAAGTFQSTGRTAAEKGVHIGGDKAAIATMTTGSFLGGVGITAALSAGLSQMEYEGAKRNVRNLYKEELASVLGKSVNKVKDGDVDKLATVNHTVAEQMAKERKQRNLNIGTIFAATAVAVGIVSMVALPGLAATPLLAFAAKGLIAMATYTLVKKPIQELGDRYFDLKRKTTHERIEDIQRDHEAGKAIGKERVFAVFASANPALGEYIQAHYGKHFDALDIADQLALTKVIGSKIGVDVMTNDINHGRVKATELAFTVEGTMSGVLPKPGEEPKQSVLVTIKEKLHGMGERITHHHHEEKPARSFVSRLGRDASDVAMSHVQQVEDGRNAVLTQQRS